MICDKCKGEGYTNQNFREGSLLVTIKVWCERCKGTGQVKYDGKREGIKWERE